MSSQGQIKSQVVLGSSLNPPCQGYDVTYNPQMYDECIYIYTYRRYVNVTIYIYVILGKFGSGTCHLFSSWCSEWTFVTLKLKVFRTFIVKKMHSQDMNLWNIEIHTVDGSEILNNHMGCKKKPINNGMNYQPQLVIWMWNICSSPVVNLSLHPARMR